jgi:nitrogen fixation NifU-like protein
MMDLRELYQDIILDHGQHPRNKRPIDDPSHFAHGHNPLCGDKVTIYLKLEDGRIADLAFEGRGCAISTASASLMTEVLKGKTREEAEALFHCFHGKVTGKDEGAPPAAFEEELERLEPLSGVRAYPVRVKCATLPWHALEAAFTAGALGATVKTE